MAVKGKLGSTRSEGTKFYDFLEWYAKAKSSVSEKGRNQKGNYKKFILEEFENMLVSGDPSEEFLETITEFKESGSLSPELQTQRKTSLHPSSQSSWNCWKTKSPQGHCNSSPDCKLIVSAFWSCLDSPASAQTRWYDCFLDRVRLIRICSPSPSEIGNPIVLNKRTGPIPKSRP